MEILEGEGDEAILSSEEHLLESINFVDCRRVLDTGTVFFPWSGYRGHGNNGTANPRSLKVPSSPGRGKISSMPEGEFDEDDDGEDEKGDPPRQELENLEEDDRRCGESKEDPLS